MGFFLVREIDVIKGFNVKINQVLTTKDKDWHRALKFNKT